jgi:2,4-dienoyl-CoA reductase (NADPH2)
LGRLELKNRIVMPALHLGMAHRGEISDRIIDFYEARARGGASMIIAGVCNSQPDLHNNALDLSEDRFVPRMRDLAGRIHAHDCLCAAQLAPITHYGAPRRRIPPLEKIPGVVENMALAAARARLAGFDAVEFLAAGGSILSYFLSPAYNPGLAGYSENLSGRLRLPLEVIVAARAHVGPDFPLFVRIHGHEFVPGGGGLGDAVAVAKALVQAGVTALDVTAGGFGTKVPQITSQAPAGAYAFLAREIKRSVGDVPVMVGNRICDASTANQILRWSGLDFVCLGRALVADPDLPAKVQAGRVDEIIPCVACCRCLDRTLLQQSLICTVNPWVGREGEALPPADPARRVAVVGGGPAGIQAATVLHERGHNVVLFEAREWLGGAIRLGSQVEGKEDLGRFVAALTGRIDRLGVAVRRGFPVQPDQVKAILDREGATVLIAATGGSPRIPQAPIENGAPLVQAVDVLDGRAEIGHRVVILGGGGVACETALFVGRKGALNPKQAMFFLTWEGLPLNEILAYSRTSFEVTVITRAPALARSVGRSFRWAMVKELDRLGVRCETRSACEAITANGVLVSRNGQTRMLQADTVILACGFEPQQSLAEVARRAGVEVHTVGSAMRNGNLLQAVHHATLVAMGV